MCKKYYKGECVSCLRDYELNKYGNCIKKIDYCRVYGESECEDCVNGYKVEEGICKEI